MTSPKMSTKVSLKSYINRCRCCLEQFDLEEQISPITDFFEIQFYAFTHMELKKNNLLSKHVCEFCHQELLRFSVFKKDLIEKQVQLYKLLKFHSEKTKENESENENIENSLNVADNDDDDDDEYDDVDLIEDEELDENHDDEQDEQEEEEEEEEDENQFESVDECEKSDDDFKTNNQELNVEDKRFICDFCGKRLISKQGVAHHITVAHTDRNLFSFKCNRCTFVTTTKRKLQGHTNRRHPLFKKSVSPSKKTRVRNVETPKKIEEKILPQAPHGQFSCFCGKSYNSKKSLSTHKSKYHGTIKASRSSDLPSNGNQKNGKADKLSLQCDCGKQFVYRTRLLNHQAQCIGSKTDGNKKRGRDKTNFRCDECHQKFQHFSSMTRHQKQKGHSQSI